MVGTPTKDAKGALDQIIANVLVYDKNNQEALDSRGVNDVYDLLSVKNDYPLLSFEAVKSSDTRDTMNDTIYTMR
jgi:hypothetical protein